MTEDNFLTYQKFSDKSGATIFSDWLAENGIAFILEDSSASFDPSFANNKLQNEYRIKISKGDFEKVDRLQMEISASEIESVDKSYYLFGFTDQELIEIVTKSDEWSKFDYLLAQKILKERGKEINKELLETLRRQRIEELAKPEDSQRVWVIAGYAFALFGGILGVFIGWHLKSHKKTLPNGDRVYGYLPEDRKQGGRILILGAIFMVIWTVVRMNLKDGLEW